MTTTTHNKCSWDRSDEFPKIFSTEHKNGTSGKKEQWKEREGERTTKKKQANTESLHNIIIIYILSKIEKILRGFCVSARASVRFLKKEYRARGKNETYATQANREKKIRKKMSSQIYYVTNALLSTYRHTDRTMTE